MISGEDINLPQRAIERYGGLEAVGSVLWLEHVQGIRYQDEDGSEIFITPEDLAAEEARYPHDRLSVLKKALPEELMVTDKKDWLRVMALHILPLRIKGNPELPPVQFDAEFKLFQIPKDLARSPTVVVSYEFTGSLSEFMGEESEDETDEESRPSRKPSDYTIAMSLRLTPSQGEVSEVGYYPAHDGTDYGLYAMEATDEVVKMQLHHRIYVELFRKPPTTATESLIAPHQF